MPGKACIQWCIIQLYLSISLGVVSGQIDKQTNKQKDMLILLIYMTRTSPVDGHSCSPSPIPVPIIRHQSPSPFPVPVLITFLIHWKLFPNIGHWLQYESHQPAIKFNLSPTHIRQHRTCRLIDLFTRFIFLSSQRLLHRKNVSLKKSRDFFKT